MARQSWVYGQLYDTGYGFPAMIQGYSERVYGELYEITDDVLGHIDVLEGYEGPNQNNHYDRIEQTVYTDQGQHLAYTYVYSYEQTSLLEKIILGDWKVHQLINPHRAIKYFAYGSCMDDRRIKKAGMFDHFLAYSERGIVSGFKLAFSRRSSDGGRADIIESLEHEVEGIVYNVNHEALDYLYGREGVNNQIYRPTVIDIKMGGKLHTDLLTFVVIDKNDEVAPPPWYLEEMIRGGTGILSEPYLSKLKEHVKTISDDI